MLESHNDVAVAIAEHIGKTEKEFAEMKKQKEPEPSPIKTNVQNLSPKTQKKKQPITTTILGIVCGIAFILGVYLA